MSQLHFEPNDDFGPFLERLKVHSQREWVWLIGKFRARLMPVLVTKGRGIPASVLVTPMEFAEEVFEECLLKFYELFEAGNFGKYSDLEATIVRISDFKLKEGFAKIKRDQRLYFMDAEALAVHWEKHLGNQDAEERQQADLIADVRSQLDTLPKDEADLLLRFYEGEELQEIADDLAISPAACRKRKQRIMDKLRDFVLKNIKLLFW